MKNVVGLDLETSGMNFTSDNPAEGFYPVSIALVKYDPAGNRLGEIYYALKQLENMGWSEGAQKLHGISREMLQQSEIQLGERTVPVKYAAMIATEIAEFIGDSDILIQTAPFDVPFFNTAFRPHGVTIDYSRVLDTKTIAARALPYGESTSLMDVVKKIDLVKKNHDAIEDVDLAHQVLQYFRKTAPEAVDYFTNIVADVVSHTKGLRKGFKLEESSLVVQFNEGARKQAQKAAEFFVQTVTMENPNTRKVTSIANYFLAASQDNTPNGLRLHLLRFARNLNMVMEYNRTGKNPATNTASIISR